MEKQKQTQNVVFENRKLKIISYVSYIFCFMEDGVLTHKGLSGHLKKILVGSEIMYLKHLLVPGTRSAQ